MIRVLLVDDSPLVLHLLQRLLAPSPDIQVVGTAGNGREALELIPSVVPDVVCTDLNMPVMNGLELTRAIMARFPLPILVVSASVEPGSSSVFQLLAAGAVEIFPKPRAILNADQDKLARELASKIRVLAGVHVFRRPGSAATPAPPSATPAMPAPPRPARIVAIGASTGGPQALHEILSRLPAEFPVPVLCVQHIAANFLAPLMDWLEGGCRLPVRLAVDGEAARPGVVYFAPRDVHLEMAQGGHFHLSEAPPWDGHRPSATVTLRSVARCYGRAAVGVLLTGMGRDGADGMVEIAAAGGTTIAQDEASSIVFGMPREAVRLGAVQHVLPLTRIAAALEALVKGEPL